VVAIPSEQDSLFPQIYPTVNIDSDSYFAFLALSAGDFAHRAFLVSEILKYLLNRF
jgi:hypothetical protein